MRACSSCSPIRISPTAAVNSVCADSVHSLGVHDTRDCDDLVSAHDQGPALTVAARDLGVHEHVLDLLAAPGEPIAGPPPPYLKAFEVRADRPRPPLHLAVEGDRGALEPEPLVLPHGLQAAAQAHALRPRPPADQLRQRAG